MATGMEEDQTEWNDGLSPPGKDLTISNFFDTDEKDVTGINVFDTKAMDHVMKEWRNDAHKYMKKKGGSKEVEEVKPEEMALQIGGTILSEGRRGRIKDDRSATDPPLPSQSLKETPRDRFVTSPPELRSVDQATPIVAMQRPVPSSIWTVPTIRETVDRILVDEPFVLEWYRTLDEKKGLLKEAISTHDGNTIITIVLFLRSTLSKAMFEALLLSYVEAAQHYCSFLRQNTAWEQLKNVYYVLGEERYAMLQYQLAHSNESINSRINAVEKCVRLLKDKSSLKNEQYYIEEYWNLLKRQQKMEEVRKALPPSSVNRFQSTPLLDSTLVTSLMYCCRFHINDQDPIVNPEVFKKDFKISEKQYFIVLLGSLCARRDWPAIDTILTPKSFSAKLGFGSKIKAPISLQRIIRIIGKKTYLADEDFLAKYIKQVDDLELRLELATKYQCYGVGIEVLKGFKDIDRLKTYFDQIPVEKQRKYRPALVKLFS
ncbi:PREDICTED: spermatogenesis-defective protein 39 homolog [Amphimedon queenslandica]|uniref:Vps16 C-terminal domain-containing protein n=1 Tax=Amphimedon queenslandica TaxID=400682 RepID=A0A1X7VD74_AMPQE|nr:PREDICTED: spermatogenesis-defective protein 39 homolog [Amphimedon queenslandica]|eukprot:XP_019849516.1 PREDICTED: spermatogenesis-defective protein 39 homolog [Amphimedon queenslandica]